MARAPNFYVVKFRNPKVDQHDHFMVMMVPFHPQLSLKKALEMYKTGFPQLEIDVNQTSKAYNNKPEAEAEAVRLGDVIQALNPDRVPATELYPPGEANRILEEGKPGATPPPGTPLSAAAAEAASSASDEVAPLPGTIADH